MVDLPRALLLPRLAGLLARRWIDEFEFNALPRVSQSRQGVFLRSTYSATLFVFPATGPTYFLYASVQSSVIARCTRCPARLWPSNRDFGFVFAEATLSSGRLHVLGPSLPVTFAPVVRVARFHS